MSSTQLATEAGVPYRPAWAAGEVSSISVSSRVVRQRDDWAKQRPELSHRSVRPTPTPVSREGRRMQETQEGCRRAWCLLVGLLTTVATLTGCAVSEHPWHPSGEAVVDADLEGSWCTAGSTDRWDLAGGALGSHTLSHAATPENTYSVHPFSMGEALYLDIAVSLPDGDTVKAGHVLARLETIEDSLSIGLLVPETARADVIGKGATPLFQAMGLPASEAMLGLAAQSLGMSQRDASILGRSVMLRSGPPQLAGFLARADSIPAAFQVLQVVGRCSGHSRQ